jgi:hypothetical protein
MSLTKISPRTLNTGCLISLDIKKEKRKRESTITLSYGDLTHHRRETYHVAFADRDPERNAFKANGFAEEKKQWLIFVDSGSTILTEEEGNDPNPKNLPRRLVLTDPMSMLILYDDKGLLQSFADNFGVRHGDCMLVMQKTAKILM